MTQSKASLSRFLKGIGIRIVALGVLPLLIMVGFSLFLAARYQGDIQTVRELAQSQKAASAEINRHILVLKNGMTVITVKMNDMIGTHLSALLAQDTGAIKKIETQRDDIGTTTKQVQEEMAAFAAAVQPLGITPRPFATPDEATNGSPTIRAEGQLSLLATQLKSLPNLFATLASSNQATLKLLGASDFDGANSNFVYEEGARMAALMSAVRRVNTIVTDLGTAIVAAQSDEETAKLTQVDADLARPPPLQNGWSRS